MGDEYYDKAASDIIFEIREQPHDVFERKNNLDLYINMILTLEEALLGFKKSIKHLDDHDVWVIHDYVTKPGSLFHSIFDMIKVYDKNFQVMECQNMNTLRILEIYILRSRLNFQQVILKNKCCYGINFLRLKELNQFECYCFCNS